MSAWIGILGMILIVVAWIPQTIENIKKKRSDINIKFVIAYLIGSLILIAYSSMINDMIFLLLNSLASIQAVINLVVELKEKKRKRK